MDVYVNCVHAAHPITINNKMVYKSVWKKNPFVIQTQNYLKKQTDCFWILIISILFHGVYILVGLILSLLLLFSSQFCCIFLSKFFQGTRGSFYYPERTFIYHYLMQCQWKLSCNHCIMAILNFVFLTINKKLKSSNLKWKKKLNPNLNTKPYTLTQ